MFLIVPLGVNYYSWLSKNNNILRTPLTIPLELWFDLKNNYKGRYAYRRLVNQTN